MFLEAALGVDMGTIISSLLYGMIHVPIWGANFAIETFLGALFAMAFRWSGYNLAVPIAAHTMYDFGSTYFIWLRAKTDFSKRLRVHREEEKKDIEDSDFARLYDASIKTLAKATFDLMDENRDGAINKREFNLAMRIAGLAPAAFVDGSEPDEIMEMFRFIDENEDGLINLAQFTELVKIEDSIVQKNARKKALEAAKMHDKKVRKDEQKWEQQKQDEDENWT